MRLFKEDTPGSGAPAPSVVEAPAQEYATKGDEALCCVVCQASVSSRRHLSAQSSWGPIERFVNPLGRFFELFTLSKAWGWVAVTPPLRSRAIR